MSSRFSIETIPHDDGANAAIQEGLIVFHLPTKTFAMVWSSNFQQEVASIEFDDGNFLDAPFSDLAAPSRNGVFARAASDIRDWRKASKILRDQGRFSSEISFHDELCEIMGCPDESTMGALALVAEMVRKHNRVVVARSN